MGGVLWEERERSGGRSPSPLRPKEPAELKGWSPGLQSPLQAAWVLGDIGGGQGDQERQVGGAIKEERERSGGCFPCSLGPGELTELPGGSPALQVPPSPQPHWSWEHRKEAKGRIGEAGGRDPPGLEEQERRGGHLPHQLEPRNPAGLPGEVPRSLRPGVGGTSGPLLFY